MTTYMPQPAERQLVADLAREQVRQIAPQELPLFRATSEAYFRNPQETLEKRASGDDMLGFGTELAVGLLTPVILEVTRDIIRFLAKEVENSLKTESSNMISDFVKRLFKRFRFADGEEKKGPPPLTHEQATRVRRLAFDKARQLNLPEVQAGLLADSLVGSLVVTSS